MSRNMKALFLSALVFTAACAGENPTGPVPAAAILATKSASAGVTRRAGGSCVTKFVPVSFVFPLATSSLTGTCNLKHLGRTTLAGTQTVNVLSGAFTNAVTYTAARGDLLYATSVGISSPAPNIVFQADETYTGGTGRFAGASGMSHVTGAGTVAADGSGMGALTLNGWLTYFPRVRRSDDEGDDLD